MKCVLLSAFYPPPPPPPGDSDDISAADCMSDSLHNVCVFATDRVQELHAH